MPLAAPVISTALPFTERSSFLIGSIFFSLLPAPDQVRQSANTFTPVRVGLRTVGAVRRSTVGGRPRIDSEMRALIRRMSHENPVMGFTADPRRIVDAWNRSRASPVFDREEGITGPWRSLKDIVRTTNRSFAAIYDARSVALDPSWPPRPGDQLSPLDVFRWLTDPLIKSPESSNSPAPPSSPSVFGLSGESDRNPRLCVRSAITGGPGERAGRKGTSCAQGFRKRLCIHAESHISAKRTDRVYLEFATTLWCAWICERVCTC